MLDNNTTSKSTNAATPTTTDEQRFIDINIDSDNDYDKNGKSIKGVSSIHGQTGGQTFKSPGSTNLFNFNKSTNNAKIANTNPSSSKSKTREQRGVVKPPPLLLTGASASSSSSVITTSQQQNHHNQKKPFNLILSNFNEINLYSDYDEDEDDEEDEDDFSGYKRRSSAINQQLQQQSTGSATPCNLDLSYDLNRKIDPILNSTTLSTTTNDPASTSSHDLSMLNDAMCNESITVAVSGHRNTHHSTPLTSNSINSIDNYARAGNAVSINTSPRSIRVDTLDDNDDTFTSSSNQKSARSKSKLTKSGQVNR